LKELIDDLKDTAGESAAKERKALQDQDAAIATIEKRIKENKAALGALTDELERKLELKRFGGAGFKAETEKLVAQVEAQLTCLDSSKREDKKKIAALQKDKAALQARLAGIDSLLSAMGGQLTEGEAKTIILRKLYDLATDQLNRYLDAEKRAVIGHVENLWDKYAVSSRSLESGRDNAVKSLNGLLSGLGYQA